MVGIPEWVAAAVMALAVIGEWLHRRRIKRIERLAFGPRAQAAVWTKLVPWIRVIGIGAACWGFASLLVIQARIHNKQGIPDNEMKHMVLVLDVSPSMHVQDAGPEGLTTRRQRASDMLASLFARIPMRQFKISLIAVYTEAKPLIKDSQDHEVVRHIMEEMPVLHGFRPGKTKLMEGIKLTAKMVKPWNPKSTYIVMLTDGDTIADKGMPTMPASVADVVVVGLGDARVGTHVGDHQSRQDTGTLRQMANRMRGTYHDGNKKHLPTKVADRFSRPVGSEDIQLWTRREWSIFASLLGSFTLAMLPLLLHYFGTSFVAGVRYKSTDTSTT
jgi:Ca-activated chloride channel family protein